ncbi:MAG: type II secretion system protein [bacterium]
MIISKRRAFTLIEMLVVMVIIGFMMTIIPSWMFRKKADATISAVLREFNNLIFIARQEAILEQRVCRLYFKSEKNLNDFIIIQIMQEDPENSNKQVPIRLSSEYLNTKYDLPPNIKMQACYLGKKELFSENKNEAYCYITPNSLVQDVIIHIVRQTDSGEEKVTFKMEPFLAEFELYNGFLKS